MVIMKSTHAQTAPRKKRFLRVGARVGKYRLVRRLGEGGFSQVWMANDTIEGVTVALKAPLPAGISADTLDALRREIRLTARLDHPNILKIKNADYVDGHLIVAYPAAERSLADRIRHRIAKKTAYEIESQILEALAYAHAKRIIHCDVKPDNVLLFPGNLARLSDFGIARVALRTIAAASGSGTIGYVAPEQAFGKPSFRSDVFSAGLLLYRLLTGVLPEWPFTWPLAGQDRLERKVSPAMLRVLQRSIQLESSRRYADAGKMLDAFQAARHEEEARAAASRATRKKASKKKAQPKKKSSPKAAARSMAPAKKAARSKPRAKKAKAQRRKPR